jgi:hypothetical protein
MHKTYSYIAAGIFLVLLFGCSPVIHSFSVVPLTITANDSVKVNWSVSGHPTLIMHDNDNSGNLVSENSHTRYREFTLVVQKHGKEISRMIQVNVLSTNDSSVIIFGTTLSGDTLVAKGINNEQKWGDGFEIVSVASGCNRKLLVTHGNKTFPVDAAGNPLLQFEGDPVKGFWEFSCLLTSAEKLDITTAPSTLQIKVTIRSKN